MFLYHTNTSKRSQCIIEFDNQKDVHHTCTNMSEALFGVKQRLLDNVLGNKRSQCIFPGSTTTKTLSNKDLLDNVRGQRFSYLKLIMQN